MLIAIVLDKPLSEAQALADNPDAFMLEITKIIQNKHAHPVIAQMLHPDVRDDLPPSECAPASSDFFSLWCGRSHSKARSLREKKL